jgi:hypothetical protein
VHYYTGAMGRAFSYATIADVVDWLLIIAPLVALESCHARHCDNVVSLWYVLVFARICRRLMQWLTKW